MIDGNLAKALVREAMLRTYIGKEVTLLMPGGIVYAGELQEPMSVEPASVDTQGLNRGVLRIKRQIVGKGQPTVIPQMTLEFTAFDDVMVSIFEESQEEALDKLKAEQAAQPAKGRLIVPGGN